MIYWCKKCGVPIFDKGLHECTCDGKVIKISESSICNPVFKQERKLLSKIYWGRSREEGHLVPWRKQLLL